MSVWNEFPTYRGDLQYICQECSCSFPADELHYTCPKCGGVFLLQDKRLSELKKRSGQEWQDLFDARARSKRLELKGIMRYYELIAPILEPEDIVYLGEGHTPIIPASESFQNLVGRKFSYKNDGQNPSASFKDRGMACAFSYLKSLIRKHGWQEIVTVCASTGDTSASAAMYAAYAGKAIKSVVLLPAGKVTPQQLGQPLGNGSLVLELPGYFDDCMKVVEELADNYIVALLNSKNSWRILGQESYAFEIAQWYNWQLENKAVFVPIGNAGNISAVLSGFLKLKELDLIRDLPMVIGVQSSHADPVFRYYSSNKGNRVYSPVDVSPSVAQAAMIGNPVSFPRVRELVQKYEQTENSAGFAVVQVREQEIMDSMLQANRHGHIACTQGGECLAGLIRAVELGLISKDQEAVLNATAHNLKFQSFQDMYFSNSFPKEYEVMPKKGLVNRPKPVFEAEEYKGLGKKDFWAAAAKSIVKKLGLEKTGDGSRSSEVERVS